MKLCIREFAFFLRVKTQHQAPFNDFLFKNWVSTALIVCELHEDMEANWLTTLLVIGIAVHFDLTYSLLYIFILLFIL